MNNTSFSATLDHEGMTAFAIGENLLYSDSLNTPCLLLAGE
jgi:hypothetical protein